jgi:hypothetical protein
MHDALESGRPDTPSFRLFGAWGFRGRRRNSFSSSLRDIRCQLLYGYLGIAHHGPVSTFNQTVVSFPAPRHSLRPGIGRRFRNTSQHRFGQRIHKRKKCLLAASDPEDLLGNSIEACGASPSADLSQLSALTQALAPQNSDGSAVAALGKALSGSGSGADGDYDGQNMQSRKETFLASARSQKTEDYLRSTRSAPLGTYEIKARLGDPCCSRAESKFRSPRRFEGIGDVERLRYCDRPLSADSARIAIDREIRLSGFLRSGWRAGGMGPCHVSRCVIRGHQRHGGVGLSWERRTAGHS